jgi:hypothetical protein
MPLSKDLREFVALLNSNEVEYLVVGAFAVAYHGFPRYTADLDIFVRSSEQNAERVLKTLGEFGFGSIGISKEDLRSSDSVIQLGVKPNRIDILSSISGITFDEAWTTRQEADLGGLRANFIGREALIQNKLATGRARDQGDAEELRKRTPPGERDLSP